MWNWRAIVVVPVASKTAAENAARQINSTGPDYAGDAFTVPLSSSGTGAPTHWGLYTSATDEMVSDMADVLPLIQGVQYWRHASTGELAASNVSDAQGQPWGWAESLDAAGLKVIAPPVP